MTDFERTIEFLKALGFCEGDNSAYTLADKEYMVDTTTRKIKEVEVSKTITVGSGAGYAGFCCDWYFDDKGKFIIHGCWE